jgi:hypothetical protein
MSSLLDVGGAMLVVRGIGEVVRAGAADEETSALSFMRRHMGRSSFCIFADRYCESEKQIPQLRFEMTSEIRV